MNAGPWARCMGGLAFVASAALAAVPASAQGGVTSPGDGQPSALVASKCLAAPPQTVLIRTADGRVLHLGNAPPARPLEGVSDAVAVAAYTDLWLVLRSNGTVLEIRDRGAPEVVPGITTAVDIAAGEAHGAALLRDGTVRTWGEKTGGIPGNGTCPVRPCEYFTARDSTWLKRNPNCVCPKRRPGQKAERFDLATADIADVAALAAGKYQTFALQRSGRVRAWGTDYQFGDLGLLGADARSFATRPVPVTGVENAVYVGMVRGVGVAGLADGSWKVWGIGHDGGPLPAPGLQGAIAATNAVALFPDGSVKSWSLAGPPAPAFPDKAVAITAESETDLQTSAALLRDGRVLIWGDKRFYPEGPVSFVTVDQETVRQCTMRGVR